MLITNRVSGWDTKINFVDSNDVFVGFDYFGQCCEVFGWYILDEVTTNYEENDEIGEYDIEGYVFDVSFFEERLCEGEYGDCGFAIFKMTKNDCIDLYLHLYNHHNGYYSHGFEGKIKGKEWVSGCF